ncbi:MAG: hypothetical protein GF403_11800 [Candidatus Coatesbacteria bacterium]|nr:hypothetical protein [Candidatus Coatesbacteria bacterium]
MSSRLNLSMLVAIFLLVSVLSAVAEEAEYAGMDEIIELLEYCSSCFPDCTYSQPEKIELENGETRYMAFIHSVELCGDTNIEVFNSYISITRERHEVAMLLENEYNDSELWERDELLYSKLMHTFILVIDPNRYHSPFDSIFYIPIMHRYSVSPTNFSFVNSIVEIDYKYSDIYYNDGRVFALTDSDAVIIVTPEKDTFWYVEWRKRFLGHCPVINVKSWDEVLGMHYNEKHDKDSCGWVFHIETDVNDYDCEMPRYSVYSNYSCGWQALTEALAWHH